MCGIVAILGHRGSIAERMDSALHTLHHRGPDGARQWVRADGDVSLGHTRLAIVDLTSAGEQPLVARDGRIRAVVNGEFYDYERIRRELEANGHRFRSNTDSEILVHLYEEYGTSCVHHLRGEFAFVLWDEDNRTLFAARDRFGIKPLHYVRDGENLMLASEVKALLAAGAVARWDHEAAFDMLVLGVGDTSRTLVQGISQLPPAHILVATNGRVETRRYWDFDYPTIDALARDERSEQECVEQFRAAFDEAVRLRLRADVPVGCYLSGGVDSSAILGFAARHAQSPIRAFTIGFDDEQYDESSFAKEMAAHAGAEFHPFKVTDADIVASFSDAVWHCEVPFVNVHGIAKFLLSQAVSRAGYRVVLTGEGADDTLAGYAHFRRDSLLHQERGLADDAKQSRLRELERTNGVSRYMFPARAENAETAAIRRVLGFVPSWLDATMEHAPVVRSLLAPSFREAFARRDCARAFIDRFDAGGQLWGRDPLNQSLYLFSRTVLPHYLLSVLGDRMEMAHSVEGRVPFLDHHLVELVVRLPTAVKIRDMTEKWVLREAAKPVLTDGAYQRQKHPFLAPASRSSLLHEMLRDVLGGSALTSQPMYEPSFVKQLLGALDHADPASLSLIESGLIGIASTCVLGQRLGLS